MDDNNAKKTGGSGEEALNGRNGAISRRAVLASLGMAGAAVIGSSLDTAHANAASVLESVYGDNARKPDKPPKGSQLLDCCNTIVLNSVVDFFTVSMTVDTLYIVKGYHANTDYGGGLLFWNPSKPKSEHNGGTVISPTVPWDGSRAGHSNFLLGVGETQPSGLGCFYRPELESYPVQMFGAIADWDGTTGFDNRLVLETTIKSVYKTVIPKGDYGVGAAGSIFIQGYNGKRIEGEGTLHKMGRKGIFSFNACTDIAISGIGMDGQIVSDEAEGGNIWDGTRPALNYAFAVSFANCHHCEVSDTRIYDFAWDGLVAQGTVAAGGESATLSTEIVFRNNKISSIRGSQIWLKAVRGADISRNKLYNPTDFAQKANAVFLVEWCEEMTVAHNRMSFIGDNAVGIGEMLNNNAFARNKRITVDHNLIKTTRYHSILVAQGEDIDVTNNIIHEAGAKTVMPGNNSVVLTAAITIMAGGISPSNARVSVHGNTIRNPYEYGVYGFDRPGTSFAQSSEDIIIESNTITGAGKPPTATRLASGGILTQFQKPVKISGNVIDYTTGDGIRVFGDAVISGNVLSQLIGLGINVPADTIWGNTDLSSALTGNTVRDATRTGISVAGRDQITLTGNTTIRCGRDVNPGTENITTATQYAGISTYNIRLVQTGGNHMRECGSSGFVSRLCEYVHDSGSTMSENGQVFTVNNLKSGAYLEGSSSRLVKAAFLLPQGDGGTTQHYPIRILYADPSAVALDGRFTNHASASLGVSAKSLINIP
ncbi:right-handed parallel beta-helix repeat-containing protein [Paenibacillus mesophilus]|uniref:right-handed parallel beta-helix repeat-containing protein n=1 Tax=Paenibacillus mesophilus TaxID=2582849 RepID=UPI00110D2646|nr:right-handed parallel beta-helix repeat-containing protein [Paenibacillus mesophilus]TMV52265.1 right-handed parallel beta-helix repeat-containing protein [Paenibacillus mesophilus]